jgi:hypothetical protein
MALHPTVARALTPGRLRVSPLASCRDAPWWRRLTRPDRPARVDHPLVSTAPRLASRPVEKFAAGLLPLGSAERRFFVNARGTDCLRSAGR